jgi:hypothetical protein
MKTLTFAERARRAAALGITLPVPTAAPPAHKPLPVEKLAAAPVLRLAPSTRSIASIRDVAPVPSPPSPAPEPPPEAAKPSAPTEAWQRFRRTQKLLAARYPKIFSWGRPLAIGIDLKLREAFTEEELPTADLKAFLRVWVRRKPYRAALARGDHRVNLDGSDAGPALADTRPVPVGA